MIHAARLTCVLMALSHVTVLAAAECTPGYIDGNEINNRIDKAMNAALQADLKAKELEKEELFKTIGPPPSADGSRLVDGADFTDVLAIAVEQELLKDNSGQTSIQLSPFAWYAAFDPSILNDPEVYLERRHRIARRFALTFATGGTGEKFDRNGDGTVDDALKSDDFNDIQTWELKYRLFGSRDWKENLKTLREAAIDPEKELLQRAQIALGMTKGLERDSAQCLRAENIDRYLASPDTQKQLLQSAQDRLASNKKFAAAMKTIATRWTGSWVAATTQQDPEFGQDKWSTGLRFTYGLPEKAQGINLNVDYSEANGRGTLPDPNSWKVGAEFVRYFWKGRIGKSGARASVSASWEMFDDIADAKHDDIGKLGFRLEIPIAGSDTVRIPISVIWANHEDVLTDSDSVRGHIGFTVDFGDAMKKQKKE